MLVYAIAIYNANSSVSVAGFLGYDVLVSNLVAASGGQSVSVAGFLGYDVLDNGDNLFIGVVGFQLLVF